MEDPRRVLEQAAERRVTCEVLPRRGGWSRGQLLRVEPGGIVISVPGLHLSGGEDLRCWFNLDGTPRTFEASVIRTGVPLPDRSQNGVLIGFIDCWTQAETRSQADHGLDLRILPPNGPGISLLEGPGRLMELGVDTLSFTLPADHILVFVEGGGLLLGLAMPGEPQQQVGARVRSVVSSDTHLLYQLAVQDAEDPETFRRVVTALQRALDAGPVEAG